MCVRVYVQTWFCMRTSKDFNSVESNDVNVQLLPFVPVVHFFLILNRCHGILRNHQPNRMPSTLRTPPTASTHTHTHTHFMGQSNLKAVDSGELCVYSCILFYQFWIKENPITQISIVSIWCAWFFQPEPATARTISCRFQGDKKFKSITIDNDDLWHLLIRLKISIARLIGYQCDVASEQIKTPSGTAFE